MAELAIVPNDSSAERAAEHAEDTARLEADRTREALEARIESLERQLEGKADRDHSHPEIMAGIEAGLSTRAEANHDHAEYVSVEEFDDALIALDDDLEEAIGAQPEQELTHVEAPPAAPEPPKRKRGFAW